MKILFSILLLCLISNINGQDFLKERSAINFANEGNYDKAIATYEHLLSENEGEPEIHYNLGTLYLQKGDHEKSIEFLNKAAVTEEVDLLEDVYYNLGNAYHQKKEFGKAVEAYKKALKINYHNRQARENLELSLKDKQEQEEQQQKSDQKQDMKPSEYAKKIKKMAEELAQKRKYLEALTLMKAGMQKDQTVSVFNGFISRLANVVDIDG